MATNGEFRWPPVGRITWPPSLAVVDAARRSRRREATAPDKRASVASPFGAYPSYEAVAATDTECSGGTLSGRGPAAFQGITSERESSDTPGLRWIVRVGATDQARDVRHLAR